MADAEPASSAGKAPVGDQGDLVAHALPVDSGSGRQHLAHAGPALRPLIADDEDVAFLVAAVLNRLEGFLFTVEDQGGAAELEILHPGNLHDRAFWRQAPAQADDAAGRAQRVAGRAHDD